MADVASKREKEKQVVRLMIEVYCRGNHRTRRGELCPQCRELADYAAARVDHCPIWKPRPFAPTAKPTATSPPCGSASAR